MGYDNRNIVLNELIGLKVRVLRSSDKKQRGLSGLVVDETRNMIVVETDGGAKRIVKKSSTFRFYAGGAHFDVPGPEICFRAVERTGKAVKFYKRRESKT
ncbi:MAG: ribonuclease P protein subunit [Candidatus Marsarchaeota archaeon]|jgi:RNase P/RNase MRP subunit p29|nr:ribonuclease P protein subunit [Candidatus Marsarchaeota archaeon]